MDPLSAISLEAEIEELNLKKNTAWKNVKTDGKKMWNLINWNGKAEIKTESLLHEYDAGLYFRNIFQSKHTRNHPTTADIANKLNTYEMHVPILDDILQRSELEYAIKHIGKCCGMDGIPASVIRLLPLNMLNNVLKLLQKTFIGNYPKSWEEQILNALPKEGHTSKTPKLRGICIEQIDYVLYRSAKYSMCLIINNYITDNRYYERR